MEQYLKVFRFGWPFIWRYRHRFFTGVLLGFLFSATYSLFIGAVKVLTGRILGQADPLLLPLSAGNNPITAIERWLPGLHQGWMTLQDLLLPLGGAPLTPLQVMGGLLLLPSLGALRGLLDYGAGYCMTWVSSRVVLDIQTEVLSRMSRMSLSYFHGTRLGDLTLRIQHDTQVLHKTFNLGMADLIKEPLTVIVVLTALFCSNWKLSLMAVVFYPFYGLAIARVGSKTRKLARKNLVPSIAQGSQLIEYLTNIRLVKAFGLESFQLARFVKNGREQTGYQMKKTQAQELLNPLVETLAMLGASVTIVYVVWSGVGIPELAGFLTGLVMLMKPVKKIAGLHVTFKNASVSVDRVLESLTMIPALAEPAIPVPKPSFHDHVAFRGIRFAYGERNILDRFDLDIRRGTKIGIVGDSGSGKSTLINLLMRFYDPDDGVVLIDGIDIKNIATPDLRKLFALVSQEVSLFDMSVAENIALGRQGATASEIEEAARKADAHDFIMELEHGYATRVAEGGSRLSGGQRQRIALARALVRGAPILLLDEATSALDSKSEAEVQTALDGLSSEYTILSVAHRLSSLRNFDRILVLRDGRIIEDGTFSVLIARGGVFAGMAARQGLATSPA